MLYGCSPQTVYRLFNAKGPKKSEFVDRYLQGFVHGKKALRTALIDEAVNKRNTPCLLFAARTYLGLDDRQKDGDTGEVVVKVVHEGQSAKGKGSENFLKMNGGRGQDN